MADQDMNNIIQIARYIRTRRERDYTDSEIAAGLVFHNLAEPERADVIVAKYIQMVSCAE